MSTPSVATRVPAAWRAAHVVHQSIVLAVAGVAFLATTWASPLYQALLAGLPHLMVPPGIPLSLRFFGPLLFPVVLGLPLVLGRQRAFVLLWVGLMAVACAVAVLEVSRLNWFAFVSGVAFRIESGPVPLVRTLSGAVVLLSGLLLLGQQGTLRTVAHLAERGVPLPELRETRRHLLGAERLLVVALFAGALLLTIVAWVSMTATEGPPAPQEGWFVPVAWIAAILGAVILAFALGLWRRRGRAGGDEASP